VSDDWDALVSRLGPAVFRTAWRVLGHAADAEDVTQEVFLEAYRLRRGRDVRSWPGLLRRLAACRALDRLRRRRDVVPLDGLALAGPDAGPEEDAIGRELAERLRQALAELPQREAEVFSLRYFDDLSYHEIADALGVSAGAVAVALHKARARLEALLTGVASGDVP
jgi:RNA polymerase sigma-70 factor (ECF subfamily)